MALIIKTEVGDFRRSYRAWSNGFHKAYRPVEETLSRLVSEFANPPRIVLLTDLLSDLEIQALHTLGDCYVSTSRGEGWGYGAYEAAWFGKRVYRRRSPGASRIFTGGIHLADQNLTRPGGKAVWLGSQQLSTGPDLANGGSRRCRAENAGGDGK